MVARAHRRTPPCGASIVAVALAICAPSPLLASTECPASGDEAVVVVGVGPGLEPRLVNGRVLRLAGLDPASRTPTASGLGENARKMLAAMLAGHVMTIRQLDAKPDRWGRIAVQAFAADGPAAGFSGGVATAAVATGLGRYLAEPAARPCHDALLDAEGKARQAKLGLWSDPYYAVLAVDDEPAFVERSATNVLVEGRLAAVEPGPYRTRLRFAAPDAGAHRGRMLQAIVLPRVMKSFEAKGVMFSSLIGRTLRLRGLLDQRFGPQIELAGPDDVEVLPPPSDTTTSDAAATGRPN